MGKKRGVCSLLVGKPEEHRPVGRPKRKWVDNINIDLRRVRMEWYGLD
jgi:hypothetical protein